MTHSRLHYLNILLIILFAACKPGETIPENAREINLELNLNCTLGEGAIWDAITQRLFFVDIEQQYLYVYYPGQAKLDTHNMPSRIGTVVPETDTTCIIALEDGAYRYRLSTSELVALGNPEAHVLTNRFNDGKCDPMGRFWFGSMALNEERKKGGLYMLNRAGELSKKINKVSISNGIVWSLDSTKMFYIDTPAQTIRGFKYDVQTGAISDGYIAVQIPDSLGYPDGMTIDANGNLWVGMWAGYAVTCWNPQTGDMIDKIGLPSRNVTSCAFGGPGLDTLYVTSAMIGISRDNLLQYPYSGGLFKVVPGVKGVPAFRANIKK